MPHDILTDAERLRYHRQLLLPEIGDAGQRALKASAVLVVGLGGLGSPAALYLAAAGVGRLGLVDADRVDAANIHRQILHGDADVGRDKADSADDAVRAVNPLVDIVLHREFLTSANAAEMLGSYDLALGCLDTFAARYDLDAACVAQGKRHVYGSVRGWEGQAAVFGGGGPCYRCFFRDPPPRDWVPGPDDKAILGPVPGVIGSVMALEAIKLLTGAGATLAGRLLLFDGLRLRFREMAMKPDPACPVCGGT